MLLYQCQSLPEHHQVCSSSCSPFPLQRLNIRPVHNSTITFAMKIPRPITALGAVLLVGAACFAGNECRLWRDTIFHSKVGGSIELPSGHRLPTNQWIVFPPDVPEIGFLQIGDGRSKRQHVIQNHDMSHLAVLATPAKSAPAVVGKFAAVGPHGYREFWVEH